MSFEDEKEYWNERRTELKGSKSSYAKLLCIVSAILIVTIILELVVIIRVGRHTMSLSMLTVLTVIILALRELIYVISTAGDYLDALNYRRRFWEFCWPWCHDAAILWLCTVILFFGPIIFITNVYYLAWMPVLLCLRDIIKDKNVRWADNFLNDIRQMPRTLKKKFENMIHNTKSGVKEVGNAYASVFGRKKQNMEDNTDEKNDQ